MTWRRLQIFLIRYVDIDCFVQWHRVLELKLHELLADVGANHSVVCFELHFVGHAHCVEFLLRGEQQTHDSDGLHGVCVFCLV